MILKFAIAILAVLLLRLIFPALVRGVRRTLMVMAIAVVVFGAVVWLTAG
jgi:hypothetical protein